MKLVQLSLILYFFKILSCVQVETKGKYRFINPPYPLTSEEFLPNPSVSKFMYGDEVASPKIDLHYNGLLDILRASPKEMERSNLRKEILPPNTNTVMQNSEIGKLTQNKSK